MDSETVNAIVQASGAIQRALELARDAAGLNEVPVGAVVASIGGIIGEGRNEIIARKDPAAHAEVLAIRAACTRQNSERLKDAVLVTTLEPCTLCTGALLFARVEAVVYMAPVFTGAGLMRLLDAHGSLYNHKPVVIRAGEEAAAEAGALLVDFFKRRR